MEQYDFNPELIKEKVKPGMKVLIQLPSGLRKHFKNIAGLISKQGAEPILWAGSCYGACDLPDYKDCDLLIHFGHKEFTSSS